MQSQPELAISDQECPQCHTRIPIHKDYVTWCDNCEWNLQPSPHEGSKNIFASVYASVGKRLSKRLYDELLATESLKPRLTITKALAFALALMVHAFTLFVLYVGLVLLTTWPSCLAILGAPLLIFIAWALRPRFFKLDQEEVISRAQCPTLYKLVDDISRALGTSTVQTIAVDEDFNAGFTQIGPMRRKVMKIGLPLLTVLKPQELVALLGHEVAHGVNGDPNRGFLTSTALNSLVRWYYMLRPGQLRTEMGRYSIFTIPANVMLAVLASVVHFWLFVLLNLDWRDSQRAEYLADALATKVSGRDAMLSMLHKLHLDPIYLITVQRVALNSKKQDIFVELVSNVA